MAAKVEIIDFKNATDKVFDSNVIEITSQGAQLKDQRPSNVLAYINFASQDMNLYTFSRFGTLLLDAAVSGGQLLLNFNNASYAKYDPTGMLLQQVFTIACRVRPQYTGNPTSNQFWFLLQTQANGANSVNMYHQQNTGQMRMQVNDSSGNSIISASTAFGSFSPVSGTQYEMKITVDVLNGNTKMWIDNVQLGTTKPRVGARDGLIDDFTLGISTFNSNFIMDDLVIYNELVETPIDWNSFPNSRYVTNNPIIYQNTAGISINRLRGFLPVSITPNSSINWVNSKDSIDYWNTNDAWVQSDGTFAQSNTPTEVRNNLDDFVFSSEIRSGVSYIPKAFLSSDDGNDTPVLSSLTVTYDSPGLISIAEIRELLEGYCIDNTIISDQWIEDRRDRYVIPVLINSKLGIEVEGNTQKVVYINGTAKDTLILPDKNVISIDAIEYVNTQSVYTPSLDNFILISDEGILKAKYNFNESYIDPVFPKGTRNIKLTYTVGYDEDSIPVDINELIGYLTAIEMLTWIEGRSGGGKLSTESFQRDYGDLGKYTNIRRQLTQRCNAIIRKYRSYIT